MSTETLPHALRNLCFFVSLLCIAHYRTISAFGWQNKLSEQTLQIAALSSPSMAELPNGLKTHSPEKCNKEVYLFAQSRDPPVIHTFPYRNELLVLCMFICYYPVWFPHRIFEEYLYLTRAYRSLPKLPYFENTFLGFMESRSLRARGLSYITQPARYEGSLKCSTSWRTSCALSFLPSLMYTLAKVVRGIV